VLFTSQPKLDRKKRIRTTLARALRTFFIENIKISKVA
jgi:hypothetical protein